MNYDEFSFFNHQLAAMLKDGIPLEGALHQLCSGMNRGSLRMELEALGQELSRGTPLKDALAKTNLPPFYVRMLEAGARTNNLPGMLTLLADHYERAHALFTRLKGLMVYPIIVLTVSLGLTVVLAMVFGHFLSNFFDQFATASSPAGAPSFALMWLPPIFLALALVVLLLGVYLPAWRGRLRWRLPAFREASLAQLASAMSLMLKQGTPLPEALALAEGLETTTPAARVLGRWRSQAEKGQGKPANWTGANAPFPPLFLWLVQQGGEDVAMGFQRASELYRARASYRIELALYGALPISILLLGQMVFWQIAPLMRMLTWLMNMLGGGMDNM